ncbi:MAG: RNA polymerase sigma factor [Myxococcota bacterium]
MDPFLRQPKFLEDFRAGRSHALDKVYRTYKKPLRHFIVRGFTFKSEGRPMYFAGAYSEADIEDVIHETFRRAFGERARRTYDGIRPYKNYLFTIARNAVITDLTAKQRQVPVGEALMRDASGDDMTPLEQWVRSRQLGDEASSCDCDELVENLEIYGLLMGFLEHLNEEEQRFFRLRFLATCSQERTAQEMGWNRARVRKVEDRLRKRFLTHARGSGYLEHRAEGRRVRRVEDPASHSKVFERSRQLWREGRVSDRVEFLLEAA